MVTKDSLDSFKKGKEKKRDLFALVSESLEYFQTVPRIKFYKTHCLLNTVWNVKLPLCKWFWGNILQILMKHFVKKKNLFSESCIFVHGLFHRPKKITRENLDHCKDSSIKRVNGWDLFPGGPHLESNYSSINCTLCIYMYA